MVRFRVGARHETQLHLQLSKSRPKFNFNYDKYDKFIPWRQNDVHEPAHNFL